LAPEPVWTGAENLAPTRILSADHPACSELLKSLQPDRKNLMGISVSFDCD